jgi:hypothetical protein
MSLPLPLSLSLSLSLPVCSPDKQEPTCLLPSTLLLPSPAPPFVLVLLFA